MKKTMWLIPLTALLMPAVAMAQSVFDGTWKANFPEKPDVYLLQDGIYKCKTCVPPIDVKADGQDHKVSGHPYYDTVNIKVIGRLKKHTRKTGRPWQLGEEVKNPGKNIPRAIIFGLLLVGSLYVLANCVYFRILTFSGVAHSSHVASDAFELLVGRSGAKWLTVAMMISALGTLHASFLAGPRIPFAMTRDRSFFKFAKSVRPVSHVPSGARLFQGSVAVLLTLSVFDVFKKSGWVFSWESPLFSVPSLDMGVILVAIAFAVRGNILVGCVTNQSHRRSVFVGSDRRRTFQNQLAYLNAVYTR
jgi:Amino acid permease